MTNSLAVLSISASPKSPTTMKCGERQRKELDSPMTTKTDASSSFDDLSLATPPPMTSRMGRVIISPSTGGSSSDYIEIGDEESRTSSPRRRNLRRSVNRTQLDEDVASQSEILISALNQLHRLATLDSTEYQQRLLENTLPSLQTEIPNPLHCPSLAERPSSMQISLLSQPIQTPLVQLSMSVHRLHAVVANISREVDGHTDEVQELQSQLAVFRRRNKQVESAAKKLHIKHIKVKRQAKQDRKIAQELQHKVHLYEEQLESQGFQLMASKVQQHEIQLQLSKMQQINESFNSKGKLRERVDSTMSDFLDDENGSHDGSNIESVKTIETDSPKKKISSEKEKHHCRSDSTFSDRSDLSETAKDNGKIADESGSGTNLKSHYFFNDTMPTLRFSAEGSVTDDKKSISSCEDSSVSKSTMTKSTVDDCSDHKINSLKKKPPVSRKEQPIGDFVAQARNKSSFLSSRFVKFLGTRAIPNYNLKMIPPCNMQFIEIPLNTTTTDISGGMVQPNYTPTPSSDDGPSSESQKKPCAFAVCGLDGFNTEVNMKPTLGARLMKINGKFIDEQWTLDKLHNELDQENGAKNRSKQISLTFRNEAWDTEQVKTLNVAVSQVESRGSTLGSKDDGGKEKISGTSLFENTQRTISSDHPHNDGGLTNDPLQRVRTASTDSVGKAINGIGNFLLQNLNHSEGGSKQ